MADNLDSGLDCVLTDVDKARGLPNSHYISESVFEEEKQALLSENWAGIGFIGSVPNLGDVKPIQFLGMPLLLVREYNGQISVYQNTCRHRGMILVNEPTNIRKVIRCPYHSWCYGLDGNLEVTPHVGGPGVNTHESIDRENLGLFTIASAVYAGVIFINLSGTAPPFELYASQLLDRWKEFDQPVFMGGIESTFELEVKTNWKLAVENYCESYHLPWIHPGLNSYSKLEDHYNIEMLGSFSGQGSLVYRQLKNSEGANFPDFDALSDKWNTGAEYIALYPNVLLGVHRDHTFALILEPQGPEKTVEHVALFYTQKGASDNQFQTLRKENADLWKGIFQEDISVVEGMQAGRHGKLFDGGKFSPVMDGPTHTFHHWVASKMSEHRNSQQG